MSPTQQAYFQLVRSRVMIRLGEIRAGINLVVVKYRRPHIKSAELCNVNSRGSVWNILANILKARTLDS